MLEKNNIVNNLPLYRPIDLVSGVDRYGFSSLLAEQFGLNFRPRAFANWLHGWIWWGANSSAELMFDPAQKKSGRFVVSKFAEKKMLEVEGFNNVWVGGLPFAYTSPSKLKRIDGSLLAMPPHSSEREKLNKSHVKYFDYLESIKEDFNSVFVCVHYLDISPSIVSEINKRGLYLLEGARPDDANSLKRMRAIFDSFEYVTSNAMGSHVAYSMFAGCKVSLCGPQYEFDESDFISKEAQKPHSEKYISDLLYYLSKDYLRDKFNFLLVESPEGGCLSDDYAKEEIGFFNKLDCKNVSDALRWSPSGQVIGYASGAMRRVLRGLNNIASLKSD